MTTEITYTVSQKGGVTRASTHLQNKPHTHTQYVKLTV